uniref:Uncharacterized protein n=1 Tax=Cacopsylla melanoneura TaxID=428564 RepID=A0A8D9ABV6_9HEMI
MFGGTVAFIFCAVDEILLVFPKDSIFLGSAVSSFCLLFCALVATISCEMDFSSDCSMLLRGAAVEVSVVESSELLFEEGLEFSCSINGGALSVGGFSKFDDMLGVSSIDGATVLEDCLSASETSVVE